MRLTKLLSAVAATSMLLGMGVGSATAAPVQVDKSGVVTGGAMQNEFGDFGPYQTSQTHENLECNFVYKIYDKILVKDHDNVLDNHPCWGTFPSGSESPVGVHYVYPKNIANLGKLPVILYTPGIGAEPGMTEHNYRMWASNGYIVAVSYSFLNWTGWTDVNGAADLLKQSQDSKSPLYNHIDASKVILTGHSAGGGATESGSGWLLPQVEEKFPGLKVVGAVPLQPGPSFFFQQEMIKVPTFIVSGEKDTMCPDDVWVRPLYQTIKLAPAWIGMLKGAPHGKAMDLPQYSANAASVLVFAQWLARGDQKAKSFFVGPNYRLAQDAAFKNVERNEKAAALK